MGLFLYFSTRFSSSSPFGDAATSSRGDIVAGDLSTAASASFASGRGDSSFKVLGDAGSSA